MTKIINLTPHPININGIGEIAPTGKPARLTEKVVNAGHINVSVHQDEETETWIQVPIIKKELGEIIDLPAPQDGIIYVVSLPVAQAAHRYDAMSIGESIRDTKGNVVAAKSLAVFE